MVVRSNEPYQPYPNLTWILTLRAKPTQLNPNLNPKDTTWLKNVGCIQIGFINKAVVKNNTSVISSKFINKFVQKCQCYYTLSDQSIPLVTVTSVVSLLTEQLWAQVQWFMYQNQLEPWYLPSIEIQSVVKLRPNNMKKNEGMEMRIKSFAVLLSIDNIDSERHLFWFFYDVNRK